MTIKSNSLREIEKISRSLSIIYFNKFKELGIQRGQHSFIIFVNENPGLSQLDLVKSLSIDKTTVAKALAKLESSGIVFRQRDLDDKRISRVYPTTEGRNIYREILSVEKSIYNIVMSTFSEKESRDLATLSDKILKNIENEWKTSRSYLTVGEIKKATYVDLAVFSDIIDYRIDHYYYIYNYKGATVGYIELSQGELKKFESIDWSSDSSSVLIENIFVLEKFRKMGFGYELLKEATKKTNDLSSIHFKIVINETNIPMLKLINLLEFRFIGEYKDEEKILYCFEKNIV